MNDLRLDVALTQQQLFATREKARFAISNGAILVNGVKIRKPGSFVKSTDQIQVLAEEVNPYVTKTGLKLKKAIEAFNLDFANKVVLDISPSNAGFLDCAIQNNAAKIYALLSKNDQIDLLDPSNKKLCVLEDISLQALTMSDINNQYLDFVIGDVNSSLIPLFPSLIPFMNEDSLLILTIKPQFEAGKEQLGNDGIVKNPKTHEKVIRAVELEANKFGLALIKLVDAPIFELKKNIEYIALFAKKHQIQPVYSLNLIQEAFLIQKNQCK